MMLYVIFILVAFLLGYIAGKQHGRKKGYKEAAAVVPLELRLQSLEKGKCIICASSWEKSRIYENFSRDLDTL